MLLQSFFWSRNVRPTFFHIALWCCFSIMFVDLNNHERRDRADFETATFGGLSQDKAWTRECFSNTQVKYSSCTSSMGGQWLITYHFFESWTWIIGSFAGLTSLALRGGKHKIHLVSKTGRTTCIRVCYFCLALSKFMYLWPSLQ